MLRDFWDYLVVPQHDRHLHLEFGPQGHSTGAFVVVPLAAKQGSLPARRGILPGALALSTQSINICARAKCSRLPPLGELQVLVPSNEKQRNGSKVSYYYNYYPSWISHF